jgi:hypothetical protein
MASLTDRRRDTGLLIEGSRTLRADVTLRESPMRSAEVTDHEVEQGASVSDHIRTQPLELSCDTIVTATPLIGEGDPERDTRWRDDLVAMFEAGELVTVTCEHGVFRSMAIAEVASSIDSSTGYAYIAAITFRRVRIVERRAELLPPVERRISATDGGTVAGTDTDGGLLGLDAATRDLLQTTLPDGTLLYDVIYGAGDVRDRNTALQAVFGSGAPTVTR